MNNYIERITTEDAQQTKSRGHFTIISHRTKGRMDEWMRDRNEEMDDGEENVTAKTICWNEMKCNEMKWNAIHATTMGKICNRDIRQVDGWWCLHWRLTYENDPSFRWRWAC